MSPFYHDDREISRLLIVLTPEESKRLLAMAVKNLPAVRQALDSGTVLVSPGSTNAYIRDLLTGRTNDPWDFLMGHITDGALSVNARQGVSPLVLVRGDISTMPWKEAVGGLKAGDVVIKGANAVDPQGNAGVLLFSREAGTIGALLGVVTARGIPLIMPVGLEKLIPCVIKAAQETGLDKVEDSLSDRTAGLMPVVNAQVITEVEALQILFGVESCPIAAGGIAGSQGSLVLVAKGPREQLARVKEVLGEMKNTCEA